MAKYRVAICFRGLIRTGVYNKSAFDYFFDSPYFDTDYFLHTWDYENSAPAFVEAPYKGTKLWEKYRYINHTQLTSVKLDTFINRYKPVKFRVDSLDKYRNVGNRHISYQEQETFNMSYHPQFCSSGEVDKLRREYEKENNFEYDLVINTRPDIIINPNYRKYLINRIESCIRNPNTMHILNLHDTWTENDIWADDVLYMSTSKTMNTLGDFYDIDKNTKSHEYVLKHLMSNKILPTVLGIPYTVLRDFVAFLDPIKDFDEIFIQNLLMYMDSDDIPPVVEGEPVLNEIYKRRVNNKL